MDFQKFPFEIPVWTNTSHLEVNAAEVRMEPSYYRPVCFQEHSVTGIQETYVPIRPATSLTILSVGTNNCIS